MNVMRATSRPAAGFAVALLLAACSVDNETLGSRPDPDEGSLFRDYVALGTSIGAGIQSGGINDNTQRQSYAYLLAQAMGLTPGADWHYPSLTVPGCPAPYDTILTQHRLGGVSSTFCALRSPQSVQRFMNNVSIPSLRAAQVLDVASLAFPATDTLKLAQFITGSLNPIDHAEGLGATFVTLEVGGNDVLGAATRGDSTLLTPLAAFQATYEAIGDRLDALTGGNVAAFGVPNVTNIPHFSAGAIFFCLRNAGCPAPLPGPTPPFNSANFTVDASCAPGGPGAVGLQTLVGFTATSRIAGVLQAGGFATLNCAAGTASTNVGAGFVPTGPVMPPATVSAIATRVGAINAYIQAEANSRGWAFVDLNGLLDSVRTASPGNIPAFPNFATASPPAGNPNTLFGAFISQDGIHPNAAAHRLIAQRAAAAINTTYGTTLTVP
jgi:lysophospholipase L1-like esterase